MTAAMSADRFESDPDSPYSETAVAADAVVALLGAGIIPRTPAALDACAKVLGITKEDVKAAHDRKIANGNRDRTLNRLPYTYRGQDPENWAATPDQPGTVIGLPARPPIEAAPAPPEPSPAPPAPADTKPRRKPPVRPERTERTVAGETWLRCTCPTDCGPTGDSWWPQTAFVARTDRPGKFTSQSRNCRALYQRARHLKVGVAADLNRLGIKFVLTGTDQAIGLACSICDQPLRVGDEVHGLTDLWHAECEPQ